MPHPKDVADMIEGAGGKVESMTLIREEGGGMHGAATASFPLPTDHWLYEDKFAAPPMPFRMGKADPRRAEWEQKIKAAARHAVRASTMNGKSEDFDPDAMVQNMIVGMLGYHSPDALCGEQWADPDPVPPFYGE